MTTFSCENKKNYSFYSQYIFEALFPCCIYYRFYTALHYDTLFHSNHSIVQCSSIFFQKRQICNLSFFFLHILYSYSFSYIKPLTYIFLKYPYMKKIYFYNWQNFYTKLNNYRWEKYFTTPFTTPKSKYLGAFYVTQWNCQIIPT